MQFTRRMKRGVTIGSVLIIAALGYILYPIFTDSQGNHGESQSATPQAEIDYYTCTMHPSVREVKPGKCPICGMELIPIYKKATSATPQSDYTFTVTPAKQQMIGVKFDDVKKRPLHKVIYAVGTIDYDERKLAVVNMRVGGWIETLFVDFNGKFVSKGQPLFELYSPELVSTQREYLLAKQALQNGGESDRQYEPDLLWTSRERLRLWGITDEQINELEDRGEPRMYLTIHSPIAGYVIEKNIFQGMRIEPGMELYKIADLSTVWVHADIYEYELSLIKLGQEAIIRFSSSQSVASKGRVTYIYPTLNPETRTVRVRIELPNPGNELKPKMYADVELHINLGQRLSIPESAVLHSGTREIVFVDKGKGTFELRFVQLGVRAEGYYEVTGGLTEGEQVAVSANFLIDAESKIQGVFQRLGGGSSPGQVQHQH